LQVSRAGRGCGISDPAAGEFQKAYERYTKAIAAEPLNAVLYSNRSAAALSLSLHREAELDAGIALSLDKTFAKAFFRRAQARLALGKLELAKFDAIEAQKLAPGKATTQLLADIARAAEAEREQKKQSAAAPKQVAEPVVVVKSATVAGNGEAERGKAEAAHRAVEEVVAKLQASGIQHSFKPPTSAFELETNLAHVKNDAEQLSAYVGLLNPATLPKVLGNSLTEEMLCVFGKAFGQPRFDRRLAAALLHSLLGAPRCEMVIEFLSDETKALFAGLFAAWKDVDTTGLAKFCK
jgi:hypothetical protein